MTIEFPRHSGCSDDDSKLEAKKKDIATLLSSHVQPNEQTVVTLSDATGKQLSFQTPTTDSDGTNQLLLTAMTHFN